jgi:hypothetical protein
MAIFTQNMYCYLMPKIDDNIGFQENRQFVRRKLVKFTEIMIIISTPGWQCMQNICLCQLYILQFWYILSDEFSSLSEESCAMSKSFVNYKMC